MFSDFLFLRPWWLLALIPAAALIAWSIRWLRNGSDGGWQQLVDSHLLAALTVKGEDAPRSRWLPAALAVGLLSVIIAMAGPAWEKVDLPAYPSEQPTVVVMSLAQSMNADDVAPSRLTRAGHKLRDIIKRMDGGDIGLVIYADRPFVAAPLTADARVIKDMLPELSTDLMPVIGNRLGPAIAEATDVLSQAGAKSGRIVVLADDAGVDAEAARQAAAAAHRAGYDVSAIGIGTKEGATMQTADGRTITGNDGSAMTATFDEQALTDVARAGGGVFAQLSAGQQDLDAVLDDAGKAMAASGLRSSDRQAAAWQDMGVWLLLIPVLLIPLAFRRNLVMVLPLFFAVSLVAPAENARAAEWNELWQTPDQQGAAAFDSQQYATAADRFDNPEWKAGSNYRAGDYESAVKDYAKSTGPDAAYNRANALAMSGQLETALQAYDSILEKDASDEDAQFNRDLVAKLLEQQEQEQQDQKDQQDQQDQQDQEQQDQDQQQQSQNEQQDQSDQQNQDQQQTAKDGTQDGDEQNSSANQQASAADDSDEADGQPDDESQADSESSADDSREAFQQAMNDALEKEGDPAEPPAQASAGQAPREISEQDQLNEQLLRSVPDDPSGLLRARIRQHYQRLRATN